MKYNIIKPGLFVCVAVLLASVINSCKEPQYPSPTSDLSATNQTTNVLLINVLPDDSLVDFQIGNETVVTNVGTGEAAGNTYNAIEVGPQLINALFAGTSRSVGIGNGQTVAGAIFPYRTTSSVSVSTSGTYTGSALITSSKTITGDALSATISSIEIANPTLFANEHYSVLAQGASGKRSRLTLVDDLTSPASGKAKIRLVNAVPSGVTSIMLDTASGTAPVATVNGTVTGWTNIISGGKSYAYNASATTVQSFSSVDASLNLSIYNGPAISTTSGVTTSATAIGASFTVQSGGIYTILVLKKNGSVTYSLIRHD